MTYWATLWYAGAVVLQLGFEGQTFEVCENIINLMEEDISNVYETPENVDELIMSVFPDNKFSFSCETEKLEIDERYRK